MPDPKIYTDPICAKGAAAALANATGAVVLQTPDGGKRVVHGRTVKTFKTWLAVWSYLYRIRADQNETERRQATRG